MKGDDFMQNTSVTIRTDKEIKDKVKSLYAALGMDLTTAVNVFFRQSLIHNGMPFDVSLGTPNAETLAALEEGDNMINDPAATRFSSVDDLFEDLMN
jgi:DNA-damage-inducible protein J